MVDEQYRMKHYRKIHWLHDILEKQKDVILSIEGVTVYRPKGNPIIQNVSFNIYKGEIIGIFGESGAGKSTLIKTILNEQSLTFTGVVKIAGVNIFHYRDTVAPLFGYVPQELTRVYRNMTAMENCMIFGRSYGLEDKVIRKRANHLFDALDIKGPQRDSLPVENLSGGEQRRVSMAVGMIHEPELLFMDEPTSGLDPVMRHVLWTYIEKLNRKFHTTIIVVTHFPNESEFCDKIAIFMKPKGFVEYGTPREILQQLPNDGFVVDVVLETFDDRILTALRNIEGVEYVLMQGERFRVFANTPTKTTTLNIIQTLTTLDIEIHKIEPKNEATMGDYFNLIAGDSN